MDIINSMTDAEKEYLYIHPEILDIMPGMVLQCRNVPKNLLKRIVENGSSLEQGCLLKNRFLELDTAVFLKNNSPHPSVREAAGRKITYITFENPTGNMQ